MTDLEAMKAAFLAKGNKVTSVEEGIAFGINAAADKVKRAEARTAKSVQQVERYVDYVRETNGYYKS